MQKCSVYLSWRFLIASPLGLIMSGSSILSVWFCYTITDLWRAGHRSITPIVIYGFAVSAIIVVGTIAMLVTPSLQIDQRGLIFPQRLKFLSSTLPEWLIPWRQIAGAQMSPSVGPTKIILTPNDQRQLIMSQKTDLRRRILDSMFRRYDGVLLPYAALYRTPIQDVFAIIDDHIKRYSN